MKVEGHNEKISGFGGDYVPGGNMGIYLNPTNDDFEYSVRSEIYVN